MTKDVYGTKFYHRGKSEAGNEERVPIWWMAPESIADEVYTESSDVVSYIPILVHGFTHL